MSDGNPPDSWYDPPECPYEINDERKIEPGEECYVCGDLAEIEIEIRDMRVRFGGGSWIAVCVGHQLAAVERFLNNMEDQ